MRFTFSDPGDGGLRTIDHIPDGRLIRLEGRNGVGKTVSLRLLALCTGAENPWADERQSWKSLVAALPDGFTIEASDRGRTISWKLHPGRDSWPAELPDEGDPELARVQQVAARSWTPPVELRIDGVARPGERPVQVQLLSGREGLLEVWTQQVRAHERGFARIAARAKAAVDDLRDAFGHLQQSWEDADPQVLERAQNRQAQLHRSVQEQQAEVERLEQLSDVFRLSQEKVQLLQEAEVRLPALEAEMERLNHELEQLRTTRDGLADQLAQAAAGGDRTAKQREELDRALRNEQSRRDAHAAASRKLLGLLERKEMEGVRRSDVQNELQRARQRLHEIETEIRRIKGDEPVLDLAHRLSATVSSHDAPREARLLASARIVASVGETQDALAARIGSLEAAGPLHRLENEELALEQRLGLLEKVVEAERALQQKSQLVAEVAAAQEQQRKRDQKIDDLAQRQAAAEAEIELLQERLVDLRDERRGLLGDANSLEDLRNLVSAERPNPEEVPSAGELETRRDAVVKLRAQLDDATTELARAKDAALAGQHVLEDYGFPPSAAENRQPLAKADEAIAQLQQHLDLGRAAFSQLGEVLTTQRPVDSESIGDPTTQLARSYAAGWQSELSSEAFQEALFEGGQLISIDVLGGNFSWDDEQGRSRRRPIQALSSGQMVYAYTKAVISDMNPLPGQQQRVIVLDEFAAYLDEHAQEQLVEDLRAYVRANDRTQVIMVLPKDPGNDRGWVAEVVE